MAMSLVANQIKLDEGYRPIPYQDSLGLWTVGWGHLLEDEIVGRAWANSSFGNLMNWLCDVNTHETWFQEDLDQAKRDAAKFAAGFWDDLTVGRREVLIQMAFQLGYSRLRMFVKFREGLIAGDWQMAHDEMLNSRWHTQTKARVERLAGCMLEG